MSCRSEVSSYIGREGHQLATLIVSSPPALWVMNYDKGLNMKLVRGVWWHRLVVPEYGVMPLQLIPMLVGFFTYKAATFVETFKELLPDSTKQEKENWKWITPHRWTSWQRWFQVFICYVICSGMDNVLSVWISAPLESVNHLLAKLNTAYKFCSKVYCAFDLVMCRCCTIETTYRHHLWRLKIDYS